MRVPPSTSRVFRRGTIYFWGSHEDSWSKTEAIARYSRHFSEFGLSKFYFTGFGVLGGPTPPEKLIEAWGGSFFTAVRLPRGPGPPKLNSSMRDFTSILHGCPAVGGTSDLQVLGTGLRIDVKS